MSVKMERKLRILFITEFLPWPLNSGGRIRSYNILNEVAKHHQITLVANDYDNVKDKFKNQVSKLHIINSKKPSKILKILKALFGLFSEKPYLSAFIHYNRKMAQKIQQITDEDAFDIVHLDHLDASIYLESCGDIPTYLDEHNYESNLLQSVIQSTSNFALRFFLKNQYKKLSDYERHILNSVNFVGTVSENDANLIKDTAPYAKVNVVPNGVDLDFFNIKRVPEQNHIIYIGSLDWQPNEDGLIWFIKEVWPIILQNLKNPKFQIVGRNPSARLLKYSSPSIEICGSVPDVRSYAAKSSVFVVPLFSGGGTRLKILEAMAMGIPIVSTATGAEGIDYQNGVNIFIANTAQLFARKIITLCNNIELVEQISNEARRLVSNKYSWTSIGSKLASCYKHISGNYYSDD